MEAARAKAEGEAPHRKGGGGGGSVQVRRFHWNGFTQMEKNIVFSTLQSQS